ncbi:hypothetical protein AVEN_235589-2 [Araneus ventricosus]|uniref:RNase H type-1 domain-containing protein n=1 Tax=Araneus ventricosus TaxID=182803 RepID=A0A4Y2BT52_ARAVE|nr:hypothetical protein AVEN_235589-2 [Araneus ventricosus]
MLYKRALERIIVYAAPAWWVGTANQRQKINSLQRQVLLAVTGAFRTTSTAALQVISGIEPADLVCEMEAALYQLKHNRPDPHFLGVHLESNQVERYLPSWAHPSTKHLVHWDQDSPDYDLGIFTDGSKLNGQVGAAFSVHKTGTLMETAKQTTRQLPLVHRQHEFTESSPEVCAEKQLSG